ncbi:GntR family transcriptional regulator [Nocardia sp. NPDC059228]|uniref:GntR family transcriptional regulator n=1 Tax=Nocardia sp. NPDC059228 TaxID=3346777 RepID=UPI00369BF169
MPPPAIWRDIADDLRRRVQAGEWAAGERISSARELMEHYDTPSQAPVVRAISVLTSEGLLISDPSAPRRGVRVRGRVQLARPIDQHFAALQPRKDRTFEEISDLADGELEVLVSYGIEPAAGEFTKLFGDEELLVRTFLYVVRGTPHQVMRSRMPKRIAEAAGLRREKDEVVGKSTESWLRDAKVEPDTVDMTIVSRLPTPEEAAELAMPKALPVMVRRRTIFDPTDTAVETSTSVIVADQLVYTARFKLGEPTC